MKSIILIFILLFSLQINAQVNEESTPKGNIDLAFPPRKLPTKAQIKMLDTFVFKANEVDVEPSFKGNFRAFLEKNLRYPTEALESNAQGKVVIDFLVDKKGDLSKIKLSEQTETKNEALVKEAIRIIKLTAVGRWNAGKKYNKAVKSNYFQTINFAIAEEETEYEIATSGNETIELPKTDSSLYENDILGKLDIEAKYNGNFKTFLEENLKYPKKAIKNNIQGKVIVKFIIDKSGKISDIKIDDFSPQKNELLVAEAIRIIKLTSGNWNAGIKNGNKVSVYHLQAINFMLQ